MPAAVTCAAYACPSVTSAANGSSTLVLSSAASAGGGVSAASASCARMAIATVLLAAGARSAGFFGRVSAAESFWADSHTPAAAAT